MDSKDASRTTFERSLDKIPFFTSFIAICAFIIAAIAIPDTFINKMDFIQNSLTGYLGWLTIFLSLCIVFFCAYIIFSPIGSIRIGGKDARPEFSTWRWFSISLCAGIGIGILFWGIGEPIFHLMNPPLNLNIEPASHQAAVFAISQTVLHWSVAQYCIYAICGVAFALMSFNNGYPFSIISGLSPLIPERYYSTSKYVIHSICLFSLGCAVISSMGSLIMMLTSCISHLTQVPRTFMLSFVVCALVTGIYVVSTAMGLKRGMAFMSKQCTNMFIFLLFFLFVTGPTVFILNMGTESFGYFITNFFRNSTLVSTEFLRDRWSDLWLITYMAAFFGYAPPIGLFLARLGKGRTVRQFLLMNIFAPTLFVYCWINTFGSIAIYYQWKKIVDVWNYVQTQGLESTVIAIIQYFPLDLLILTLFVVIAVFSFATLADPMTSMLATLSTKGISIADESPRYLKIIWGVTMGATSLMLVATAGLSGLRGMFSLSGALMMFITVAICVSVVKMGTDILRQERHNSTPRAGVASGNAAR